MSCYLGVDPGLHGGLTLLSEKGDILWVLDMPLKDGEVDPVSLFNSLSPWKDGMKAFIEKVGAFPGAQAKSTWGYAKAADRPYVVLRLLGVNTSFIEPEDWYARLGLKKRNKSHKPSLEWAASRWPGRDFEGKDGRTDSACVAEVGRVLTQEGEKS